MFLDGFVAPLHFVLIGAKPTEISKDQIDYINVPVDVFYKPDHILF